MSDIQKAREILEAGGHTCVLVLGDSRLTSNIKGISPMLDFIEAGTKLEGYSAADKIVGKAAAMLFAYCGVKEVFAEVLSKSGEAILNRYSIKYSYRTLVDYIINRSGTGLCPMEETVGDIDELDAARNALVAKRNFLRGLQG